MNPRRQQRDCARGRMMALDECFPGFDMRILEHLGSRKNRGAKVFQIAERLPYFLARSMPRPSFDALLQFRPMLPARGLSRKTGIFDEIALTDRMCKLRPDGIAHLGNAQREVTVGHLNRSVA